MGALLPPPIGTKRLLWHYRSKDERLIAFSNSQPGLYDWSLTTFPGSRAGRGRHPRARPLRRGPGGPRGLGVRRGRGGGASGGRPCPRAPGREPRRHHHGHQAHEPDRREPAPGPPRGPGARRLHGQGLRREREVLRQEPRAGPRRRARRHLDLDRLRQEPRRPDALPLRAAQPGGR